MKYKYNGSIMDERMEVFLESFLPDLPPYLEEIACISEEKHVPIIRQQTRKLLSFIIKTRNVRTILEIGTAIGYSALCMAYDNDVRIDTIEKVDHRVSQAKGYFDLHDEKGCINLIEGDALNILPKFTEENRKYDMVFMDAAKGQYPVFAEMLYSLLNTGGIMVTDNVMQEGEILESRYAVRRRNRTIHTRMRNFLYEYTHSELWESIILPIGDGVMISVKK